MKIAFIGIIKTRKKGVSLLTKQKKPLSVSSKPGGLGIIVYRSNCLDYLPQGKELEPTL